ncbi:hypothetical protein [Sphingomonas nostoxanthinifaciens]|uniref:hypothetical protein n=1 Tax=Sphingomonas nostoxanthinifaciens TaxID=2872652 RepID=UPI001CC200EA|nr:hypothetical protein [Sphingomonas nostoxanthinifaciens]UAK23731.1 hypothetical protein K8P63_15285 [Sphingomonas nostoxanthinifaciens]
MIAECAVKLLLIRRYTILVRCRTIATQCGLGRFVTSMLPMGWKNVAQWSMLIGVFTLVTEGVATAAAPADETPPMVRKLLDCRTIGENAARLACFDAQAGAVADALKNRDLVVADQPQLQKARRSLFGLSIPILDTLVSAKPGDHAPRVEEGESEINATIASASQGYGGWTIVLDDGARWVQIDTQQLPRDPKRGMPVRIRKAAMGSYMANVDRMIAMRVKRQN